MKKSLSTRLLPQIIYLHVHFFRNKVCRLKRWNMKGREQRSPKLLQNLAFIWAVFCLQFCGSLAADSISTRKKRRQVIRLRKKQLPRGCNLDEEDAADIIIAIKYQTKRRPAQVSAVSVCARCVKLLGKKKIKEAALRVVKEIPWERVGYN
jgi:hypothetical protein